MGAGRLVFLFGNGGSATTASHFAEDLGKNCLAAEDLAAGTGRRLKVMSLTDNVGWITALANDLSYDQVFLQQMAHFGGAGDLAIAISGSGNSPNVIAAVDWANRHGLVTFGMTGFDGGKLKRIQKAGIHVPWTTWPWWRASTCASATGWWTILAARISRGEGTRGFRVQVRSRTGVLAPSGSERETPTGETPVLLFLDSDPGRVPSGCGPVERPQRNRVPTGPRFLG